MRYVIVDCGAVGLELARRWVAAGHQVTGTTADPEQLPALAQVCGDARLVDPSDAAAVSAVVSGVNAAVLATRPPFLYSGSVRERVTAYRRSMIATVRAAATAQRRLVLFSSIVVYGDGGPGAEPVTEQTPLTTTLDPAAQSFGTVERMVLQSPTATVLRLPEAVVGHPNDPDPVTFVRGLRAEFGDKLPFDAAALIHTIDYRDVAAAVEFVVAQRLAGVYNTVPEQITQVSAGDFFNGIASEIGLPPFTFTGEIAAPRRPVSSAKLREAGFSFAF